MLLLAILSSLIILSCPMFAPRRERVMQTVTIDEKLFESPKMDTITFDEYAESLSKRYNSPN
jgi:predicted nucleotidyltransferase